MTADAQSRLDRLRATLARQARSARRRSGRRAGDRRVARRCARRARRLRRPPPARAAREGRADPFARGDGPARRAEVRHAAGGRRRGGHRRRRSRPGPDRRSAHSPCNGGPDDHGLVHRLLALRAHGDRHPDRLGRRRGRPRRHPARDAPDDPRLRPGSRRRHRRGRPGRFDRPLVPDPRAGEGLGAPHGHDHAGLDCRAPEGV